MQLEEFVSTSIVQIAKAIWTARYDASHLVAIIPGAIDGKIQDGVMNIEFDVAITVEKSHANNTTSEGGARGGIKVIAFDASAGAKRTSSEEEERKNAQVSRVKFSVPVNLHAWYDKDENFMPNTKDRKAAAERRAKVRKDYIGE